MTDHKATCIHHQRVGGQQGLDLGEPERAFFATGKQPGRGHRQRQGRVFDLGRERRDRRVMRCMVGARQRGTRGLGLQPPHRDARDDQFVNGPRRRRQGGRDRPR